MEKKQKRKVEKSNKLKVMCLGGLAEIGKKIVARTGGGVVELVRDVQSVHIVDEVVEGAVAAADDDAVLLGNGGQQGGVVGDGGDIVDAELCSLGGQSVQAGAGIHVSLTGAGIVQYMVGHGETPFSRWRSYSTHYNDHGIGWLKFH